MLSRGSTVVKMPFSGIYSKLAVPDPIFIHVIGSLRAYLSCNPITGTCCIQLELFLFGYL